MQKIIPHLWFNNRAEEAVDFYIHIFDNSNIFRMNHYEETGADVSGREEGSVMTIDFTLDGNEFIALNAGQKKIDLKKLQEAYSRLN